MPNKIDIKELDIPHSASKSNYSRLTIPSLTSVSADKQRHVWVPSLETTFRQRRQTEPCATTAAQPLVRRGILVKQHYSLQTHS